MIISFSSSPFSIMDEYCKSMSGFVQGIKSSSNLVCKRFSSTQIKIEGYSDITANTALSFDIYLKSATNSITSWSPSTSIYVYSQDDKLIVHSNTGAISFSTTAYGSSNLKLENAMRYKIMKDTAR
jgi:hypothetical protein